jgi:hypothetical protein
MGEKRNAYWVLVGKPEGKRPLGRHRLRWEDLGEMGWGLVEGSCEYGNEPLGSIKCREIVV